MGTAVAFSTLELRLDTWAHRVLYGDRALGYAVAFVIPELNKLLWLSAKGEPCEDELAAFVGTKQQAVDLMCSSAAADLFTWTRLVPIPLPVDRFFSFPVHMGRP